MRTILDSDPRRKIHFLMILAGALGGLFMAFTQTAPEEKIFFGSLFVMLVGFALGGAIFNIIHTYVLALVIKWTGFWFGGKGSYMDVRSAVAWVNAPLIWLGILKLIEVILFNSVFPWTEIANGATANATPLVHLFAALNIALGIWIVVILVRVVAEAHKFSSWTALAAVVVAVIILGIICMLISWTWAAFLCSNGSCHVPGLPNTIH